MTVLAAETLVTRLVDWGVDTVFGLPGDGTNGLYDAELDHQPVLAKAFLRGQPHKADSIKTVVEDAIERIRS